MNNGMCDMNVRESGRNRIWSRLKSVPENVSGSTKSGAPSMDQTQL